MKIAGGHFYPDGLKIFQIKVTWGFIIIPSTPSVYPG